MHEGAYDQSVRWPVLRCDARRRPRPGKGRCGMSTFTEDTPDDIDVPDDSDGDEELELTEDPAADDEPPSPPLKSEEIESAFRRATSGFAGGMERWAERAARGMTYEELAQALKHEIGIFGGQCG